MSVKLSKESLEYLAQKQREIFGLEPEEDFDDIYLSGVELDDEE